MDLRAWYDRKIMPRLITCACGQKEIDHLRAKIVPVAYGSVLEIGCGGGLNQRHYDPAKVTRFAGIDPNETLRQGALSRARARGWDAEIRDGMAEEIPFSSELFDTVVCTYTLCSVDNHAQAIGEMRRVLKHDGVLLFLEHGRAPDAGPAAWQRRIEPIWKRLAGNCHLTRPIGSALEQAGLTVERAGQGYLPHAPRFLAWMEWGMARRAPV
ncbi:S-adenosylmethionine-dependent methyltransferase [Tsuneonella deserti]|uniref:S-adenosylmethionine-dependent methyltransferase n=1 Tax=Tsuneonella deserti TaxID=2035528 RepID=A0ABQ1S6K6_9SPHN|nr:class I SAM-dependent methyltransferase [Tsuneonella deserti]GGD93260.1 S-adenosylmethionine-dependent methyltransferase [Tsuneonella deserti]